MTRILAMYDVVDSTTLQAMFFVSFLNKKKEIKKMDLIMPEKGGEITVKIITGILEE